ncbi:protein LKAAEAR1-like [Acanthaster planci]|uniref:Protein LKAAEAR1-like n=1 Tax=Acanthaster planci TaxID=133434 RepID=A0A8B7ZFD4_ACAPL|nr:protein LKAAEAR1-like [Acanthaster planci]
MGDKNDEPAESRGKFRYQNRKKLTAKELNQMDPTLRSKYLAYEDPPKQSSEAMEMSHKRIQEQKKVESIKSKQAAHVDLEKEKHSQLIGQLKAAEARNRLRVMRLRYQSNRAQEVKHLISCQPTAIKAVRLQAMVPPVPDRNSPGDALDKLQRSRVETVLEDERGLTINRDLS